MPETRDTDWDWEDFYHRNNDELVATWGNLANRVLSFTYKNWDGKVPDPGELTPMDQELLRLVEKGFETVAAEFEAVHLRAALAEAMRLAARSTSTWIPPLPGSRSRPTGRLLPARSMWPSARSTRCASCLRPCLPFTSEKLSRFLGSYRAHLRHPVHRGGEGFPRRAPRAALRQLHRAWCLAAFGA